MPCRKKHENENDLNSCLPADNLAPSQWGRRLTGIHVPQAVAGQDEEERGAEADLHEVGGRDDAGLLVLPVPDGPADPQHAPQPALLHEAWRRQAMRGVNGTNV